MLYGRPLHYSLHYRIMESTEAFIEVNVPIQARRYTVNLLYPRTAYEVGIAYVNEVGRGLYTFIKASTTAPTGKFNFLHAFFVIFYQIIVLIISKRNNTA